MNNIGYIKLLVIIFIANILESFFALSKEGISTVDLEGINSPKRAFNKLGYGGEINPYYHLRKTLR